jgi:cytochrome P450
MKLTKPAEPAGGEKRDQTGPVVSVIDSEFISDSIRGYAHLRERAPLIRMGSPDVPPVWLVTRCDDVKAALSDPRFVVDFGNVPGYEGLGLADQILLALGLPSEHREYATSMLLSDGEAHARLRRLIAPAFSARRIKAMRSRVEQIAQELVAALAEKKEGDLIDEFALPLTSAVICGLIGIDEADQPQMRQWMHDYTNGQQLADGQDMVGYTKKLIERRRATPTGDMISALIQSTDKNGDRLTEGEIIAMVLLLVNNGHLSTANFIPNAIVVLFDHPDQLARLRAEPELLPPAMNELMRVASPLLLTAPRYATEDLEFAGVQIFQGEALSNSLQAANYDPRIFPDPERVDITREIGPGEIGPGERHVAFGAGPHHCLGAALALMEGEVALDHLLLRNDSLSLAVRRDELEYADVALGVKQLTRLPICLIRSP